MARKRPLVPTPSGPEPGSTTKPVDDSARKGDGGGTEEKRPKAKPRKMQGSKASQPPGSIDPPPPAPTKKATPATEKRNTDQTQPRKPGTPKKTPLSHPPAPDVQPPYGPPPDARDGLAQRQEKDRQRRKEAVKKDRLAAQKATISQKRYGPDPGPVPPTGGPPGVYDEVPPPPPKGAIGGRDIEIPAPIQARPGYYPLLPADKRERIVASAGYGAFGLLPVIQLVRLLSRTFDDAMQEFGDRIYEFVHNDTAAGGSVNALKYSTFRHDGRVVPAIELSPEKAKLATPEELADWDLARECADLCEYTIDRLEDDFNETLKDYFLACIHGTRLGELIWGYPERGQYKKNLILQAIDMKPRYAWAFVADPFFRPVGIQAVTPRAGWAVFPMEKFAIQTWGRFNGDPRGTSLYRPAVPWWSFRKQLLPEYYKHCQRFASPVPWAELPPESQLGYIDPANPPEAATLAMLEKMQNGAAGVIGQGGKIGFAEPSGNGETFLKAFDYSARQIVLSILLAARSTMEAEHGSKRDSESSQDVTGNLISDMRRWMCRFVKLQIFHRIIKYNYGPDIADRLTPNYDRGTVEHQDVVQFGNMIANLVKSSYPSPSQYRAIDAMIGLPERTEEDVALLTAPPEVPGTTPPQVPEPGGDINEEAVAA